MKEKIVLMRGRDVQATFIVEGVKSHFEVSKITGKEEELTKVEFETYDGARKCQLEMALDYSLAHSGLLRMNHFD